MSNYMQPYPWDSNGGGPGGGPGVGSGGDQGGDRGIMYLWSPLAIFCVAFGILIAVILIVVLAVMIYNYCTYGMCCCPSCSSGSCCLWSMCCPAQPEKRVVVNRRRGSRDSRCSQDSIRVRKPRQQIVVDDGSSDAGGSGSVLVVSRPNIDRKIVRIADEPEVHTIKVRRPGSEMGATQQPIIVQPQVFIQQQPNQPDYPQPQQRAPQSSFQGGELRVVIGNGYQQQRSSAASKPMVYNMASNNQRNEYVLTTVDGGGSGGGMQFGGGGGGRGMQFGGSGGGGIQFGGSGGGGRQFGGGGGIEFGEGGGGMQFGGGGCGGGGFQFGNGGDSKGYGCQDDMASSFSDGQRSAIIDIGHGVG